MILLIVAGANGSGKTTFAKEFIKEYKEYVYLNADEIKFYEKVSDIKASKIFLKRLKKAISENRNILMETTLSGKYIFNVIKNAKSVGYNVEMVYIYVRDVFENIKRVEIRAKSKEGHFVKKEDIIRRFFRSLKNFCLVKDLVNNYEIYLNDFEYELIADSANIYNEEVFSEIIKNCNSKKSS